MSEWPGDKLGMCDERRQIVAMHHAGGRHAERTGALGPLVWLTLLTLLVVVIAAPVKSVAEEPITPIRPVETDAAKTQLGGMLFRDVRLSKSNTIACISCHQIDRGGDDNLSHPLGADALPLDFNAPTIFNAALNYRLNWRGNFRTLE